MLLGEDRSDGKKLRYFYDSEGMCGFRYYNGSAWTEYVYVKNAKGDVLAILSGDGTAVANYSYDAWGNCTVESQTGGMGDINPIRYRGYYYDGETGLYYLLTRYYDPAIGHFISPDGFEYLDPETIGAINLYAYCRYNPVMNIDIYGTSWTSFWNDVGNWFEANWKKIITIASSVIEIAGGIAIIVVSHGTATAVGIGLIGSGVGSIANGFINESNGGSFIAGWHGGQVSGLISTFVPYVGSFIGAFAGSAVTDVMDGNSIDWGNATLSGVLGGLFGRATGVFGNIASQFGKDAILQTVNGLNIAIISIISSVIDYFRIEKAS